METNFQYISAAITDRGLSEKRPQNEDAFLELNKSGLFAVADGVGGAQAGEVASSMAMEILGEAFVNMQNNGDAEEVMKAGIEKANTAIYQMSHDLPSLSSMATTIVAVHLAGNIATIGHVGDSRLYRLDGNGNLHRETQDHSIVEEEVRAGRMTAAQAANHPSRNVISRALGAEPTVEVDLKTIMFEPNTTFLLCSDGITRHIEDYEIREMLSSGLTPEEICREMKVACYERGAEDNLTAVIVRISSELTQGDFDNNQGTATDFEEPTVASARPAVTTAADFTDQTEFQDEAPTQDLNLPEIVQNEQQIEQPSAQYVEQVPPIEDVSVPAEEVDEINENAFSIKAAPSTEEIAEREMSAPNFTGNNEREIFNAERETSSKGLFGKLASALIFLLIGAAIGAGVYYFYSQNQTPPPQVQTMPEKSTNIALTGFEENRRNVDKNPQQYLNAVQSEPKDAEDYYLRGRAFLLTGKYPEAKQAFTEAKNRLGQTSEINSKILATEIVMAMAIIDNPIAQKAFEKDMQSANPNLSNTNNAASNANANTNR